MRTVRADPPIETGELDGLAWARFAPAGREPTGGVVVLHGADSMKESHFDFARACAGGGLAALAFDARMADLLRERAGVEAIGLRGSSMGGYLALVAAEPARAGAVVAICAASAVGLAVGVRAGRFGFAVDRDAVVALLGAHDETAAARALDAPLLLLHAEGDEVVPVELSRALHAAAPASKLVVVPGGHHRSIQHDAELQGVAVRFLSRALRA
jgi:pimeloyl-ACP methyl ester carboxylesterase